MSFERKDLVGKAKTEEGSNDKESVEDAFQQQLKIIHKMENDCHVLIKDQEKTSEIETNERKEFEKLIYTNRPSGTNTNSEEMFAKILEKSLYDKARDKMKLGKQQEEEDEAKEQDKDYLAPILEKLNYQDMALQYDQAMDVKNHALKRLKERLLTRAEIIQRRLEAETQELEQAFVSSFLTSRQT